MKNIQLQSFFPVFEKAVFEDKTELEVDYPLLRKYHEWLSVDGKPLEDVTTELTYKGVRVRAKKE